MTSHPGLPRRALLLALMLGGFATPAAAQMYPGEGITVNPQATGASRVLLTPGGQYVRVVPPLLQPGAPYPGQALPPVHLHMPRAHHHTTTARSTPPAETEAPPPQTAMTDDSVETAPPPPPRQKPVAAPPPTREAAVPPPHAAAAIPFSFSGQPAAKPAPQAPAPQRPKAQAAEPEAAKPEATKPEAMASIAPATRATPTRKIAPVHGEAKEAAILFDSDSTELTATSSARLKDLSASLNQALLSGADRVELVGYGGQPGDKSSEARRISLKRALAIREALIVDGLPANRIDVRALGGVDDTGATDRVDIFVKG